MATKSAAFESPFNRGGYSLYREDNDIRLASYEQPHDDATNCSEINAKKGNLPIQRLSIRTRRQPERLNFEVFGGLD